MLISTDIVKDVNGNLVLKTDTDVVPYIKPYRVKVLLSEDEVDIDYINVKQGELLIKHERELNDLVFDINDNGELIVIGEDAENYYISDGTDGNKIGELIYLYDYNPDGIGFMIIEDTFIIS